MKNILLLKLMLLWFIGSAYAQNVPISAGKRIMIQYGRLCYYDQNGAIKQIADSSTLPPAGSITNTHLATGIDASKLINSVPFVSGGGASAATGATTGAMTVSMVTKLITITPTGACTFNATNGTTGQTITFVVTTSGTSSFVLTFGTNFKSTATLSTGTTTAKIFAVTFICTNGTQWVEISRTAAQ